MHRTHPSSHRQQGCINIPVSAVFLGWASVMLTGCTTVGPDHVSPQTYSPPELKVSGLANNAPEKNYGLEDWWTLFGDSVLNQLENDALRDSPTLAGILARVHEARARLCIEKSDTKGMLTNTNTIRAVGETSEKTIPIERSPVHYRDAGDSYRNSFDASYELDLWGRVRRSIESATAQYSAALDDERGARLVLTADVAQSYFLIRGIDAEMSVVQKTLKSRREATAVIATRVIHGLTSEFDLHRARTDIALIEVEIAELQRRRDLACHALALLTGKSPAALSMPAHSEALPSIPSIPAGIPANTICRRPDVAAAENLLHARTAEIGVAIAAKYPSIRLTGSGGFESNELSQLLERPAQFWQLGPTIQLPLFNGGRIEANIQAAQARADAAKTEHRQRALTALREIEDALVDLRQQATQYTAITDGQSSANTALLLIKARYDSGLISYLEVLDAQRNSLQFDRTQVQLHSARLAATIRLIRALGGSFVANT